MNIPQHSSDPPPSTQKHPLSGVSFEMDTKISSFETLPENPRQGPEKMWSVNGNNLSFVTVNTTDKDALRTYGNTIFERHPQLDSCIFLKHETANIFHFLVYEKDGSFSAVCGNGLGGAMQYVASEYAFQEAIFQNRLGDRIPASLDSDRVSVVLEKGTPFLTPEEENMLREKKIPDILPKIKLLADPMRIHDIEAICGNTSHAIYFHELFRKLADDADFATLCQSLNLKTGYRIAGEPHVIIEFDGENISDYMRDTYLKAVSFCLRDRGFLGGSAVNYMFFDAKNRRIFPSERGVDNGVAYDQTGACGSGTLAVGTMLFQKLENMSGILHITQRSGQTMQVLHADDKLHLSFALDHITNMQEKKDTSFHTDAVYDRFCYQIEKYCGISVEGKSYEEIFSLLEHDFPKEVGQFHDILGNILVSSCLHESEFPIDPYKISSSLLGGQLMEKMGIEKYYDPYLDTLPIRTSELKGNLNVSVFNPEILGEKTTFLRKIVNDFFSENPLTLDKSDVWDIYRFLKSKDLHAEVSGISSPRVCELLGRVREHFARMFEKENILYAGFLQEITRKTGLHDLALAGESSDIMASVTIPGKLDKDGTLKTTSEKGWFLKSGNKGHMATVSVEGIRADFLDFLFGQKLYHALHELYPRLVKNMVKNKNFLHITHENDAIKAIHQSVQNAVLSLVSQKFLPPETVQLMRDKGILDQKNRFEKELSSRDGESEKYAQIFQHIFAPESEFGVEFLETYLKQIIPKGKPDEKPKIWGLGTFSRDGKIGEIKAMHLQDGLKYAFCADIVPQVLSTQDLQQILQTPESIVNLSGGMMILVLLVSGTPMIGSERGYREAFLKTCGEHFGEKYEKFSAFSRATYLVGDYTPEMVHFAFPAGTDYTPFGDVLSESLVFGEQSGQQMMQDFSRENMIHAPKLSDTALMSLLQESDEMIEKRYAILEKIEAFQKENRKTDVHMQDILRKAQSYARTPSEMLQRLYAQFQFMRLYREYI